MKRYDVRWSDDALAALAEMWASSRMRSSFAEAQADADRRLAENPQRFGEEVSEGLHRVVVPPLVAYYELDTASRRVFVTAAGEVRG